MATRFLFEPRRQLGRTGFRATVLGIGDLADRAAGKEQCITTLIRAMDAGLNVIDTAPSYEDGFSEEVVGAALAGRRESMFVIDKIDHFDRPVAGQVEASLARLGIPTVDAFIFHGCSTLEQWRQIASAGGGMDELGELVKRGLVRFRGISSHDPQVLVEAIRSELCDVVEFAVGPHCDARYLTDVLPMARDHGVGTVCFKTFGAGKLLGDTLGYGRPLPDETATGKSLPKLTVAQCMNYTLTCDPDVALVGLSSPQEQDEAFAAAASFVPFNVEQMAQVQAQAARAVAGKGPVWWNPAGM